MRKAAVILFFCVSCLWAEVPNEITYQGRLREYGQPVNGTRTMRFCIYDAASNGTQRWTSGDVNVSVSTGAFAYTLTPASIDWRGKDYWIETIVSGKVLSPREKITAQAFALHSQTAESLTKSSGDIKFEIGATSCVVINSGGLRINSGALTFPNGSTMSSAGTGSAVSISNNLDAVMTADADGNGSGDIKIKVGTTEKLVIPNSGEVKSSFGGSTYYMVPRGGIIMWSGAISGIPPGWGLCDGKWYDPNDYSAGQTGQSSSDLSHVIQTPNLMDRFILSVSSSLEDPGAIGGANSKTISADQLPVHSHNGSNSGSTETQSVDHSHGGTIASDGSHSHEILSSCAFRWGNGGSKQTFTASPYNDGDSGYPVTNGAAGSHDHKLTLGGVTANHTHLVTVNDNGQTRGNSIDFRPAYYKLAFIMKL